MALLSVIIPVYNAEKTVGCSIESVLAQRWKDLEVIVVDDGSSDGSLALCREYAKKDSRIKVIHQQNSGPGAARNTGLQNAKGSYIAFVDADDYIEMEMYSVLIERLCTANADIAICGYVREYYKGEIISASKKIVTESVEASNRVDWQQYFNEWYYKNYFNVLWNKIYKKEIIDNYNIAFRTNICNGEDLVFNLSYFSHIQKIVVSNQMLYHYIEKQGNSLTHRDDPDFFLNKVNLFEVILKFCKSYFSDLCWYSSIYIVFLRDCFQSIDRAYDDKKAIKQIINHPYAHIAIQNSASASGVFLLYRLALKSQRVWVARRVSNLRRLLKNYLLGR